MITASIEWHRDSQPFTDKRYSREHRWRFDGGLEVPASSSPEIVRPPMSNPSAVDPEEAFVAALSSCHMLWFLSLAASRGLIVNRYRDQATGELGKSVDDKMAMTCVVLKPRVDFHGPVPPDDLVLALHHEAHVNCFIANSVTTEIRCEPVLHPG